LIKEIRRFLKNNIKNVFNITNSKVKFLEDLINKIFRTWYYFRTGYGNYVSRAINLASFGLIIYFLTEMYFPYFFIDFFNLQGLYQVFIVIIAAFSVIIFLLLAILLGWIHFQKTLAFETERDINVESNPYFYKPKPGYEKEWDLPTLLFILKTVLNLQEKFGLIPEEEKSDVINIIHKINYVIRGGVIGKK